MDKPYVLFWSKFCKYSQAVLKAMNESPVRHRVFKMCVDDKHTVIPSIVNQVPTLYMRLEKRAVVGDAIYEVLRATPPGMTAGPAAGIFAAQQSGGPMERMLDRPGVSGVPSNDLAGGVLPMNAQNGAYSIMAGDSKLDLMDLYRPISEGLEPSSANINSGNKNTELDDAYERMISDRNREAQPLQRS